MKAKFVKDALNEINHADDQWANDELEQWELKKKAKGLKQELANDSRARAIVKPESTKEQLLMIYEFYDQLSTGYGYINIMKPERNIFNDKELGSVDVKDPLFRAKKYHHQRYMQEFVKYLKDMNPNFTKGRTLGESMSVFTPEEISDIFDKGLELIQRMDSEEEDWIEGVDDHKSKSIFYEAPKDGPHAGRNWDNGTDWR